MPAASPSAMVKQNFMKSSWEVTADYVRCERRFRATVYSRQEVSLAFPLEMDRNRAGGGACDRDQPAVFHQCQSVPAGAGDRFILGARPAGEARQFASEHFQRRGDGGRFVGGRGPGVRETGIFTGEIAARWRRAVAVSDFPATDRDGSRFGSAGDRAGAESHGKLEFFLAGGKAERGPSAGGGRGRADAAESFGEDGEDQRRAPDVSKNGGALEAAGAGERRCGAARFFRGVRVSVFAFDQGARRRIDPA